MQTREIKGRVKANSIKEEIRSASACLKARGISPKMVAVVAGSDPSVLSYVEVKKRLAEKMDIILETLTLPSDVEQGEMNQRLEDLGEDSSVHGIILELPLPSHLNIEEAISCIPSNKDVDGLTVHNLGLLLAGREEGALVSATAQACIMLAEEEGELSGKKVALIGKGRTVGRPLIPMLLNRGATLTVCHSRTEDLRSNVQDSEIIFSGVGKPGILNAGVVREGQIIIDAGTSFAAGRVWGDADESVNGVVAAFTPVPEGVGPLTTVLIFSNLIKAINLQEKT